MQQLTKTHTPFFAVLFMANVILLALSRANRWLWSLLYLDLRRGKFVASFWRANALATFTGFSCVWGRTISNLTLATQRHFNEPPVEATLFFFLVVFHRSCQTAISVGKMQIFLEWPSLKLHIHGADIKSPNAFACRNFFAYYKLTGPAVK